MRKGYRAALCSRGHKRTPDNVYPSDGRCIKCVAIRLIHRKYALSYEAWMKMFDDQKGLCLGCYRHQKDVKETFCVDHDHITGKIRGLLCRQCNLVLGNAADNAGTLRRLADYLDARKYDLSKVRQMVEETGVKGTV